MISLHPFSISWLLGISCLRYFSVVRTCWLLFLFACDRATSFFPPYSPETLVNWSSSNKQFVMVPMSNSYQASFHLIFDSCQIRKISSQWARGLLLASISRNKCITNQGRWKASITNPLFTSRLWLWDRVPSLQMSITRKHLDGEEGFTASPESEVFPPDASEI